MREGKKRQLITNINSYLNLLLTEERLKKGERVKLILEIIKDSLAPTTHQARLINQKIKMYLVQITK